jgi:hypothetical protein
LFRWRTTRELKHEAEPNPQAAHLGPRVHHRSGWPRPSRFPSLSLNQAPRSPTPLLG